MGDGSGGANLTLAAKYGAGGEYEAEHPDWHAADGPGKALDIYTALIDAIGDRRSFRFLDVGCGTGSVTSGVKRLLNDRHPNLQVEGVGIDLAPYAIERGRSLYPDIDLRVMNLEDVSGEFDAVLCCDVLEHVENPFSMLRDARRLAPTLIVRQPLQGDFGLFRTDGYKAAIEKLGHIQFFNERSFTATAISCGWKPSKLDLLPAWALHTRKGGPPNVLRRTFDTKAPHLASFMTSGFYLNGSFRRV